MLPPEHLPYPLDGINYVRTNYDPVFLALLSFSASDIWHYIQCSPSKVVPF